MRAAEFPAANSRTEHRSVIDHLDPRTDAREILYRSAALDLPWEYRAAILLALTRADLPVHVVDVDDVEQLLTIGTSHPATAAAIARLRGLAATDPDAAQRLLAVLAVAPARFCQAYGWRYLTARETAAAAVWYGTLAALIGLAGLPRTFTGLAQLVDDTNVAPDTRRLRAAVRTLLQDGAQRLPAPGRAGRLTRRLATVATAPLATVGVAVHRTPARHALEALYQELGLTRRSLVLLMPNRRDPRDDQFDGHVLG